MARRAVSVLLASSLLGLSLAGCGAPATPLAGARATGTATQARPLSGRELALQFANQVEAETGRRPVVQGSQVIMPGTEGDTAVYDFGETPRTGLVVFRAGDLETKFRWAPREQVHGQAIPPILVAIAVKMVWGGTKAFLKYYLTHPGDKFNKKDCVKAVVYGMVAEGLTAIPVLGGVLAHYLWPIAWKWVDKWIDGHWPWDGRRILEVGMEFQDEVARALQQALEQSPAD